jgi:hypothetical protein
VNADDHDYIITRVVRAFTSLALNTSDPLSFASRGNAVIRAAEKVIQQREQFRPSPVPQLRKRGCSADLAQL